MCQHFTRCYVQEHPTYVNDMQCLINASLLVERELCIDFRRNLARNNLQDLTTELHKQIVKCSVDLIIDVLAVLLAILACIIQKLCIFGFLGSCEDQGWVGGGILGLILVDRGEITGVADDGLNGKVLLSAHVLWHWKVRPIELRLAMVGIKLTVPVALSWSREEDMVAVQFFDMISPELALCEKVCCGV